MSKRHLHTLRIVDESVCQCVSPPSDPMSNARDYIRARYHRYGRTLLVYQRGQFYHYDGTCWPRIEDGALRSGLYQHFEKTVWIDESGKKRPYEPSRRRIDDLVDALKAIAYLDTAVTTPSWLSSTPFPADEILACNNGLLHIPTRTLLPHSPDYYVHHAVPFAFDIKAGPPTKWLTFLNQIWPFDGESVETLQELFGYMLSGDSSRQKLFLLVGPKRSGKGTIARILAGLMGREDVAGPTLAGMGTNFGLSPLIDKSVAIISDARIKASDTSIITERLLSISGEDYLTVDRKYREPWTGKIPARFLILSNELPKLADSSGALASRFIIFTMTRSFYGQENLRLTDELMAELPGIFGWSLDGLDRLRNRGQFRQPAASQDAINNMEDLGSPIGAFLRARCLVGPEHLIPCDELHAAWQRWCRICGSEETNAQVFGRDLRAVCPGLKIRQPRRNGRQYRVYQGICLTRDDTHNTQMYTRSDL